MTKKLGKGDKTTTRIDSSKILFNNVKKVKILQVNKKRNIEDK